MPAYPLDEKAAFVEHVCCVLAESRYGTGSLWQGVEEYRSGLEEEPVFICDLLWEEEPQSSPFVFGRRHGNEAVVENRVLGRGGDLAGRGRVGSLLSPLSLGRGSPHRLGTQREIWPQICADDAGQIEW